MKWVTASAVNGPVGQPVGTIDDAACDHFLDQLRTGLEQAAEKKGDFILNLASVDHIAASGLLTMIKAHKEAVNLGVKIILACPTDVVREMLEISRYQTIFDIVDELQLDDRA